MRRFINSITVLLLMWGGTLCFIGAWIFLAVKVGGINAGLFAGLVWVSAAVERQGPHWAARFISHRIRVAQREAETEAAPVTERSGS